jgi:hypothetical protein
MPTVAEMPKTAPWLICSRCLAIATVVVVAVLFVTAGALIQAGEFRDIHGGAAIALHVVTGVLTVTLAGLARQRRYGWPAMAVSLGLFVFSFVQAYLGKSHTLGVHVPGALLATAASIWLACWLFARPRS